jgi:hypothetical protein
MLTAKIWVRKEERGDKRLVQPPTHLKPELGREGGR